MKPYAMTWEQYAYMLETDCYLFGKRIAQLEAELADWHDRRDEKFQDYEDCIAKRDALRKLIGSACRHMERYAPDPAPFNQTLWELLNKTSIEGGE